jgi:hypothetical protein
MTLEQAFAYVRSLWGDKGVIRHKVGGPYRLGSMTAQGFAVMGEGKSWAEAKKRYETNAKSGGGVPGVIRFEVID